MNKKGFTLIEIIVSIAIILLIAAIAIPSVTNIANKNKQKEYDGYVDGFIAGAKLYVADNSFNTTNCVDFNESKVVTISDLITGEYINENIPVNPLTDTKFDGTNSRITISCSNSILTYRFSID